MKVTVNGQEKDVTATTVAQLLTELKVPSPEQVAVEVNGEILEGNSYHESPVLEGDQVEFLYFMGGGGGIN